ncbi:MAG: transposase [Verrucomicrobiales bacterium]|jgi:putative transposase|nr:transposase [Verrucomicrobiales bacterium]MBP9223473.1 transposase [Verrucomicrobiales bacterium]
MPRTPRVEYENAVYHVKARGKHLKPIVFDDDDRKLFCDTFAEACGRTGWEVFAWVLMDNHYHAVFRTPEPNLVTGMQWFQNAYTRRLNARKKLRGALFDGRYRAIPIEDAATSPRGSLVWRDYLRSVIDYVHLVPGCSGIVDGSNKSCLDYPWSSLAKGYSLAPSKRPPWLAVAEGLDLLGFPDSAVGRRRSMERLDGIIRNEGGDPLAGELPLSRRFERGWFWGSEAFRGRLVTRFEKLGSQKRRNSRSRKESPTKDHGVKRAAEIIAEGAKHFGITVEELRQKRRGDLRRSSVAWAIAKETTVPQEWIAKQLNLKSAANTSQQIRLFHLVPEKELVREVKAWKLSRSHGVTNSE